jgi:hypothetical protein
MDSLLGYSRTHQATSYSPKSCAFGLIRSRPQLAKHDRHV